jgi:sugar transferase (PEP-CTERM/EpsH1 system associated)
MSMITDPDPAPPLIVHIVDRIVIGGMENGIVNLINRTPPERFRHAIICLRYADDFRSRLVSPDVAIFELHKKPGKDIGMYARLWRLLRELRPAIVHTRNLPTADLAVVAVAAGVPRLVHGEHGWDVSEQDGDNVKYNLLRRVMSPMIHTYIAVSRDIEGWLRETIGVPGQKVRQIYNGVDAEKFFPARSGRTALPVDRFAPAGTIVIGTVGRMEVIKGHLTLVQAFIRLAEFLPERAADLRLVIIGTGSLMEPARTLLRDAGLEDRAWLPGARDDVPDLLRAMDIFVLPSLNEGISNTIIEAMATGLPVVATRVGGNSELVVDGKTGTLVPAQDPARMTEAIRDYVVAPALRTEHGGRGRARVEHEYSLERMVADYLSEYDALMTSRRAN